jgi:hypothetical protein
MTKWSLLAFIFCIWILCCVPALLEKAIQNAKLPQDKRGGVSLVPIIPLFALLFWGVAVVIDYFFAPWGTRIMSGLHIALAVIAIIFTIRYSLQLRAEK